MEVESDLRRSSSSSALEVESVDLSSSKPKSSHKSDLNDHVLIERNGKFILVRFEDLTLTEKEVYGGQSSSKISKNNITANNFENASNPASQKKNGDKKLSRSQSAAQEKSSKTVKVKSDSYEATYKLTSEQKNLLAAERKEKHQRERKEAERIKEEKERKAYERDEAFQSWLRRKREEANQSRQKSEHCSESSDKSDDMNDGAFNEWIKLKNEQRKKEKRLQRERASYLAETSVVHSKQDCSQAYKGWLKKKREEEREQRETERILLELQRTRKVFKP